MSTSRRRRRRDRRRTARRARPTIPWWAVVGLVLAVVAVAVARLAG